MLSCSRPRGASLIELVVVLAVLGVAGAAVARIATHQQRRYGALASNAIASGRLREGSEVLASALAGIAAGAGDIHGDEMRESSIEFRSPRGTYLLCGRPSGDAATLDVVHVAGAPSADESRDAASADDHPAAGDSLWLYDAGPDPSGSDDLWRAHVVTASAASRISCAPAGPGDVATTRLTVAPAPSPSVEPHAPVRVFRRTRYALYRAGDGHWYLGFSDCRPLVRVPPCAPMQPVSGPYLPAQGSESASGLTLRYLDRAGLPTGDPLAVAAIEFVLRTGTSVRDNAPDTISLRRTIALRNTRP